MRRLFLIFYACTTAYTFAQTNTDYKVTIAKVLQQRDTYKTLYNETDATKKDSVITAAQHYLIKAFSDDIFPAWYGTPWDFNGTSRTPGQGKIACGYFVTNVLTDVGFDIPRVRWAQSASEIFIKQLAPNHMKRFHNRSVVSVKDYLISAGNGLYLVGLDYHVGFVLVEGNEVSFIHSNYYQPDIGVMKEPLHTDNPFKDSDYRVIGKLLTKDMIVNWLTQHAY